ncbi:flagellar protein FlhE [Azotobacter sp. CWF10]
MRGSPRTRGCSTTCARPRGLSSRSSCCCWSSDREGTRDEWGLPRRGVHAGRTSRPAAGPAGFRAECAGRTGQLADADCQPAPGRARSGKRIHPLQPPALAQGQRLAEVRWRFVLAAGAPVQAWLCHPQRCIELPSSRGRSSALAGLDAGQPLQFRFRLASRAEPQPVEGIELIVEYR